MITFRTILTVLFGIAIITSMIAAPVWIALTLMIAGSLALIAAETVNALRDGRPWQNY